MPRNVNIKLSRIFSFGSGTQAADYRSLLVPETVSFSNGNGSYGLQTDKKEESLAMAYSILKEYYSYGTPQLEEISSLQYDQAVSMYRSVTLDFGFSFPFSFLAELADCSDGGVPASTEISAICFSNAQ